MDKHDEARPGTPDVQLLTVPQVAAALSLSVRTVWALIAAGRLKAARLARRATRIDSDELLRFIEEATVGRVGTRALARTRVHTDKHAEGWRP